MTRIPRQTPACRCRHSVLAFPSWGFSKDDDVPHTPARPFGKVRKSIGPAVQNCSSRCSRSSPSRSSAHPLADRRPKPFPTYCQSSLPNPFNLRDSRGRLGLGVGAGADDKGEAVGLVRGGAHVQGACELAAAADACRSCHPRAGQSGIRRILGQGCETRHLFGCAARDFRGRCGSAGWSLWANTRGSRPPEVDLAPMETAAGPAAVDGRRWLTSG